MNDVDVDAVVDELIEELLGSLFTLHEHQYGRCDALQKTSILSSSRLPFRLTQLSVCVQKLITF